MLPRIAHYWRREQVETMMTRAGLRDVRVEWVNEMSSATVGVKRGSAQSAAP